MERLYGELLLLETGDNATRAHAGRIFGHDKEMMIITTPYIHYNVVQVSVLQISVQRMLPRISTALPRYFCPNSLRSAAYAGMYPPSTRQATLLYVAAYTVAHPYPTESR